MQGPESGKSNPPQSNSILQSSGEALILVTIHAATLACLLASSQCSALRKFIKHAAACLPSYLEIYSPCCHCPSPRAWGSHSSGKGRPQQRQFQVVRALFYSPVSPSRVKRVKKAWLRCIVSSLSDCHSSTGSPTTTRSVRSVPLSIPQSFALRREPRTYFDARHLREESCP